MKLTLAQRTTVDPVIARMQRHAALEQKIREAEIEVALQAHVRDAVLSFKATRR